MRLPNLLPNIAGGHNRLIHMDVVLACSPATALAFRLQAVPRVLAGRQLDRQPPSRLRRLSVCLDAIPAAAGAGVTPLATFAVIGTDRCAVTITASRLRSLPVRAAVGGQVSQSSCCTNRSSRCAATASELRRTAQL